MFLIPSETIHPQQHKFNNTKLPTKKKMKKVIPVIDSFVIDYLAEFLEDVKNSQRGFLSWHRYTKARFILDHASNRLKSDSKELPLENINSFHPLSENKNEIVSNEIIKLLQNKIFLYSITEERISRRYFY